MCYAYRDCKIIRGVKSRVMIAYQIMCLLISISDYVQYFGGKQNDADSVRFGICGNHSLPDYYWYDIVYIAEI